MRTKLFFSVNKHWLADKNTESVIYLTEYTSQVQMAFLMADGSFNIIGSRVMNYRVEDILDKVYKQRDRATNFIDTYPSPNRGKRDAR